MEFNYENKTYKFPTSLSEITLRQRIDFDKFYGKSILDKQNQVYKFDEVGNKLPVDEIDELMFNIEIANKNFSFFTGISLEEVEKNISIENVLNIYHNCFSLLYQQQNDIKLQESYFWNGDLWFIEKPELTYQTQITFNELIVSKQIVKQMHDLGAGNWESMVYLAAIFLKREGEQFSESWLEPTSARVKIMHDLPMNIAIAVGFFLAISTSLYTKNLQSLEEQELQKDQI